VAYFLSAPGAVDLGRLHLDSPALRALKAAGVAMAVPLVSQGELIGVLNLGPRLSQQEYSSDDRGLLNTLATQAAPAVRVGQLVRQQKAEARERERIEQELRIARIIQQTLLPKELPSLPGWHVQAYYQPARAVGGDFYDFLPFDDGRLGIVIGDVTDKGVPAALVMATTRSILRASAAQAGASPGHVLGRANELLCPDIPAKMFVTCLYGILEPGSGRLLYANAGHDLPYHRCRGGASELRATGMPLGLMPGMHYEERETLLAPGDSVLFYSDGLVEAHNPEREMFGFPRLAALMGDWEDAVPLIERMLGQLAGFTGAGWEQEDDVTLVSLQREANAPITEVQLGPATPGDCERQDAFEVASAVGNERAAMRRVGEVAERLGLSRKKVEQLKTAVAEATMNAMEHGNHYQADVPVRIEVCASPRAVTVRIRDAGGTQPIPEATVPDLEAKLTEHQTPRGWGLFLIKNLVDEMQVTSDDTHHTIELIVHREGDPNASQNA
jgi:serine phosphatase RsbU (regulator of sigma subunit)/anti-sigma regulatory factor (Ser/Thr protein kinase)